MPTSTTTGAAAWILVLMTLVAAFSSSSSSSSAATVRVSSNAKTDLAMAIEEMRKANYFTFVVLINLAPPDDLLHANLTFLMPKDASLSGNTSHLNHPNSISDFLRRHSIPSPLLLEHFLHFPTGSVLPTSQPGFILNITNIDGNRKHFSLNNVRIISPNICSLRSSIRCHGIDDVIQPLRFPSTPSLVIPPPPSSHFQTQFGLDNQNYPNPPPPPPSNSSQSQKSGSRSHLIIKLTDLTPLKTLTTCLLMLLAVKSSAH